MNMYLNLTPKQKAFADAYIKTGSAPEAALSAYSCSNRNSARVMGYKARHNPKVRAYLQDQVLEETLVNEGVESLREALRANKMITNRRGEVKAYFLCECHYLIIQDGFIQTGRSG